MKNYLTSKTKNGNRFFLFIGKFLAIILLVTASSGFLKAQTFPEGFEEGGSFPPSGWTLSGNGNWQLATGTSAYGVGNYSTWDDFWDYGGGTQQQLTTPVFTAVGSGATLQFDESHAAYFNNNDQLQINYSTDGGATWNQLVLLAGNNAGPLTTVIDNNGSFTPAANQWQTLSYSLVAGTNRLQFNGISAFGNNLYLDNINVIAPTPSITSFSPTSGCAGTIVDIQGSNFTNATSVLFNGVAAITWQINNDNDITATVPAGASTGMISVCSGNGCGTTALLNPSVFSVNGPIITFCPGNVVQNNDPGLCSAVINYPPATTNNNTDVITYTQNSGTAFSVGSTTVTVTATNNCGASTCSFTVTVNDVEAPVLSGCSTDISANTDPNLCTTVITFNTPTATDNCSTSVPGSMSFNYTGSVQNWTVPSGVSSVTVDMAGANGGTGAFYSQPGGLGGRVQGTLNVNSGDVLNIYVGQSGAAYGFTTVGSMAFNGGGGGYEYYGGGGGGGTDIRVGGTALTNRVVVAGGGGGGSYDCSSGQQGGPGGADNQVDGSGYLCGYNASVYGTDVGYGGDQFSGGPSLCGAGSLGTGGNGCYYYGGTGGGGYYGGGAGYYGGGGGGSNYVGGLATTTNNAAGYQTGNGYVYLNYSVNYPVVALTSGLPSGSAFPAGTTQECFTATDGSGNTSQCCFNVVVTDNQAPTISCPGNQTRNTDPNICTYSAEGTEFDATFSDNCGATVSFDLTGATFGCCNSTLDFVSFYVGTTNVVWTATDNAGNTATCSFNVVVLDAPTITCPSDVSNYPVDQGLCTASNVPLGTATATDACGASIVSITSDAPGVFPLGNTVVIWTATNSVGNTSTCSQNVMTIDNQPPVFNCPSDITLNADQGLCSATVTFNTPSVSDNCGGSINEVLTFNYTGNQQTWTVPVGTTSMTAYLWGAGGGGGGDNSPNCGMPAWADGGGGGGGACSVNSSIAVNAGDVYTITIGAGGSGGSGNGGAGGSSIITGPAGTFNADGGGGGIASTSPHTSSYNAGGAGATTGTGTVYAGGSGSAGDDNNGITGTGGGGGGSGSAGTTPAQACGVTGFGGGGTYPGGEGGYNSTSCNTTTDSNGPAGAAPGGGGSGDGDYCSNHNGGAGGAGMIILTFNVSTNNITPVQTSGLTSGSAFPVGTTANCWMATDGSGNTSQCCFNVVVIDNQPPVITCPSDITVNTDPNLCTAVVCYSLPTATDNCSPNGNLQFTYTGSTQIWTVPAGVTSITVDAAGGQGGENMYFGEVGGMGGRITGVVNVSSGQNLYINVAGAGSNSNYGTTYIEQPAAGGFAGGGSGGDYYGGGGGGYSSISTSPNLTNALFVAGGGGGTGSYDGYSDLGGPGGAATSLAGAGTDGTYGQGGIPDGYGGTQNAGGAGSTYFCNLTSGSFGQGGSSCNYNIYGDNWAGGGGGGWYGGGAGGGGSGGGGSNFAINTATSVASTAGYQAGNGYVTISYTSEPTITLVSGMDPCAAFPVGTTTNVYIATDNSGNTATCSFTVTVEDAPTVTCPTDVTVDADQGQCYASNVNIGNATATDVCGGTIVSITNNSNTNTYNVGNTVVIWTAVNNFGNSSTCSQNVTVIDNQPPVFTNCSSDISVDADQGLCSATVTFATPVATDNCGTTTNNPGSLTFNYTGAEQSWTVPAGNSTITVDLAGANGGAGLGGSGGLGGRVQGTINVNTGDVLNIYVGQSGAANSFNTNVTGAFNGGGGGWEYYGGGGGGGTDIRLNGTALTDRVAVAGAGGGAGYYCGSGDLGGPGGASTQALGAGYACGTQGYFGYPGNGGDQVSGGTSNYCNAGSLGMGGNGCFYYGGGGGGGYYGGGAGYYGGGGGGSNYVGGMATTTNNAAAYQSGNGYVIINYNNQITYPVVVQTSGLTSGSSFGVGTTTECWTATDVYGNTSQCCFNVVVIDNQPPVIVCPSDITVNTDQNACTAVVCYTYPTATDNCGGSGIQTFNYSGSITNFIVPPGATSLTVTAAGAQGGNGSYNGNVGGNGAQITGTVSVNPGDVINIIVGQQGIEGSSFGDGGGGGGSFVWDVTQSNNLLIAAGGGGGAGYNYIGANGGAGSATTTPTSGGGTGDGGGGVGGNGGNGGCGYNDGTSSPYEGSGGGGCGWYSNGGTGCYTDMGSGGMSPLNGGAGGAAVGQWAGPGGFGGGGDAEGNGGAGGGGGGYNGGGGGNIWNQNTLAWGTGGGGGSFNAGTNQTNTAGAQSGNGMVTISWNVTETITLVSGLDTCSAFPVGTTTNIYMATDFSGNTATCSFNVTVLDAPTITCPADVTVDADQGLCSASNVNIGTANAVDLCGGTITSVTNNSNTTTYNVGTTVVIWTAVNNYGNSATCSQNVTVIDNQPPVFSNCPANVSVNTDPNLCSAVVSFATPTATDNCGGTVNAPAGSVTFNYTGSQQAWTVPPGITNITVDMSGGSGGSSYVGTCGIYSSVGGLGGRKQGSINVVSGSTLYINVGGEGGSATSTQGDYGAGGYNGGGNGGYYGTLNIDGGGGGGASDIREGGTGLTNRIFVAAGGGGGGAGWCANNTDIGGSGGDLTGQAGMALYSYGGAGSGGGGTQTAGGAGGISGFGYCSNPGSLGNGGNGCLSNTTGGGGGGGYYGGGSGDMDGGGGGSNYSDPSATGVIGTQGFNSGNGYVIISYPNESVTYPIVVQTSGLTSGSAFPVGTTTECWTATDQSGNTSQCCFNVTVSDNQPPVITCPSNVTVNNDQNNCTAVVCYTVPTGTDNCSSNGTLTFNYSGSINNWTVPAGVTTVTVYAAGAQGGDGSAYGNYGGLGAQITGTVGVNGGDVLGIIVGQQGSKGNSPFYSSGGGGGGSFVWDVTQSNNPLIVAGGGGGPGYCFFCGNSGGNGSATTSPSNGGGAGDGGGGSGGNGGNGGAGTNTFPTYPGTGGGGCGWFSNGANGTITDMGSGGMSPLNGGAGGAAVGSYAGPGGFGGGGDAEGNGGAGGGGGGYNGGGGGNIWNNSSWGCGGGGGSFNSGSNQTNNGGAQAGNGVVVLSWMSAPVVTLVSGQAPCTAFPVGNTTNIYMATDIYGNTATCSFTVTVNETSAPTISCPANATFNTAQGVCTYTESGTSLDATFSDNCPGEVLGYVLSGSTTGTGSGSLNGTSFNLGTTNVAWTVTDQGGNTATCSFTVTVVDNQVPVISCPSNITATAGGNCTAVVSFTVTATDNCGSPSVVSSPVSGSTFNLGTVTVTNTATDGSGNTATCSFTVTVVDHTAPVISCPANITASAGSNCNAVVTFSVTATDNCGNPAVVSSPVSGSTFNLGNTTVTSTATDGSGNTATCSFTVRVVDNTAPVITCPANITTSAGSNCNAVVTFNTTATDNCGNPTVVSSPASGSTFNLGNTTVTGTATDGSGNTATCSFTVRVVDNTAPVITCPASITTSAGGNCNAVVTYSVTATDNCGSPSVVSSPVSGSTFNLGNTTVTGTATDGSGNTSTCSFTVRVVDNTVPVITCPANITTSAGSNCNAVVTFISTATDNCGNPTVVSSPASGSTFNLGNTTVTSTATDGSGNTATCSFTVRVVDNTAPVISCPSNITTVNNVVTFTVTATDNCGAVTVVSVPASGSTFAIGTTTVTSTATDGSGNTATCSFTVTVTCQPPAQPGAITGAISVCAGTAHIYNIAAVTGATSYTWTLPNGWTGTSTLISIHTTAGTTSGNITVTANNACGSSTPSTLAITVSNGVPVQPGPITGDTVPCHLSNQLYTIAPVAGATSYIWTKPLGWVGTSTTDSLTITSVGNASGNITVLAVNACGNGPVQTLAITVASVPPAPGAIQGHTPVCNGSTDTFYVAPVNTATSYVWTLPAGWSGSSTTDTIIVTAGAGGGNITVRGVNNCGQGTTVVLFTTVQNVPATPGQIFGASTVCQGSVQTYTIANVLNATSYYLAIPAGWSGSSTTTSITVTVGTSSGNLVVLSQNSCGFSTSARTLSINAITAPAQPGAIVGNSTVCQGVFQQYHIAAVSGATSYTWTLPNGWTGTSTTVSINTTPSGTSGNITVVANNSCGSSPVTTLAITVNAIPAEPGTISGATTICKGTVETYTIASVAGATSYVWTKPAGWIGSSTTTTITFTTVNAVSGAITVKAVNSCGSSAVRSLNVTANAITAVTITGNPGNYNFCAQVSPTNVKLMASAGYTSYAWSPSGGNAQTATVSSANTYTVTATNSVGCTSTATKAVTNNCALPTNLATTQITGTSAKATFITSQCAVNYTIEISTDQINWTMHTITVNSYTFTGLSLSTTYYWRIQTNCNTSGSINSGWSATQSFTTAAQRMAEEGNASLPFNIYPNPADAMVTIAFSTMEEGAYNIKLIDMMGRVVKSEIVNAGLGENTYIMNLDGIAKAVYTVTLQKGDYISKAKLVVE